MLLGWTISAHYNRTTATLPISSPAGETANRSARGLGRTRGFLVSKDEDRQQRLRTLHQPLQEGRVRGSGIRHAESDPG